MRWGLNNIQNFIYKTIFYTFSFYIGVWLIREYKGGGVYLNGWWWFWFCCFWGRWGRCFPLVGSGRVGRPFGFAQGRVGGFVHSGSYHYHFGRPLGCARGRGEYSFYEIQTDISIYGVRGGSGGTVDAYRMGGCGDFSIGGFGAFAGYASLDKSRSSLFLAHSGGHFISTAFPKTIYPATGDSWSRSFQYYCMLTL